MRAVLLTLIAVGALAGTPSDAQAQAIQGKVVAERTKRLMTSIAWVGSRSALAKAAKASGKMQFWLQVVGELDGGL